MIRRFVWLVRKEALVAYRNYLVVVILFLALVYALIMRFAVPAETSVEPNLYLAMPSGLDPAWAPLLDDVDPEAPEMEGNVRVLASREEVVAAMAEDANSLLGAADPADPGSRPEVETIFQGHEAPAVRNLLRLSIEERLSPSFEQPVRVDVLDAAPEEPVPFNESLLPLFLLSEASLVGLFLIAALVFIEKSEGTFRAYRVSPGGIVELLASKVTVMVGLGLLLTALLTPAVVGARANYAGTLALVALGGAFGASLGLAVASFFDSITGFSVWMLALTLPLTLPMLSYLMPSFSPAYIRALPTYPLLFGLRSTVFGGGAPAATYAILAAWAAAAFVAAVLVYRARLAHE